MFRQQSLWQQSAKIWHLRYTIISDKDLETCTGCAKRSRLAFKRNNLLNF